VRDFFSAIIFINQSVVDILMLAFVDDDDENITIAFAYERGELWKAWMKI
jgi:hypothetical protein